MSGSAAGRRADGGNGHTGRMFRWAARAFLFRFLPRRLLPFLTVLELVAILRAVRKRQRYAVNEPTQSRTAPPPPVPGSETTR